MQHAGHSIVAAGLKSWKQPIHEPLPVEKQVVILYARLLLLDSVW